MSSIFRCFLIHFKQIRSINTGLLTLNLYKEHLLALNFLCLFLSLDDLASKFHILRGSEVAWPIMLLFFVQIWRQLLIVPNPIISCLWMLKKMGERLISIRCLWIHVYPFPLTGCSSEAQLPSSSSLQIDSSWNLDASLDQIILNYWHVEFWKDLASDIKFGKGSKLDI